MIWHRNSVHESQLSPAPLSRSTHRDVSPRTLKDDGRNQIQRSKVAGIACKLILAGAVNAHTSKLLSCGTIPSDTNESEQGRYTCDVLNKMLQLFSPLHALTHEH